MLKKITLLEFTLYLTVTRKVSAEAGGPVELDTGHEGVRTKISPIIRIFLPTQVHLFISTVIFHIYVHDILLTFPDPNTASWAYLMRHSLQNK